MEQRGSSRHGNVCAAAILSLCSLIIGACSSAPGEPAPVYMMGMAGTAIHETAAAAPAEQPMAPVALAAWTEPSGSVGHTVSDVIPLDDPPLQPAPAPARRVSGTASTGEMLSTPAPSMPAASAAPAAAPTPVAPPPATALAGHEPSAAEEARAEAAPQPARERTASEPARADLVTAGTGVSRGHAAYSRPSYYWP